MEHSKESDFVFDALGEINRQNGYLNAHVEKSNGTCVIACYRLPGNIDPFVNNIEGIRILNEILHNLHLSDFKIVINDRRIFKGLAEIWGFSDKFDRFLDEMIQWGNSGENRVMQQLARYGFTETQMHQVQHLARLKGSPEDKLKTLDTWFTGNETGRHGVADLRKILSSIPKADFDLDLKEATGMQLAALVCKIITNDRNRIVLASSYVNEGQPITYQIEFITEQIYETLKAKSKLP